MQNVRGLAGHAIMCVRFKLRKDQRDLLKRAERMTLEQQVNTHERIERGQAAIEWLKGIQEGGHGVKVKL